MIVYLKDPGSVRRHRVSGPLYGQDRLVPAQITLRGWQFSILDKKFLWCQKETHELEGKSLKMKRKAA